MPILQSFTIELKTNWTDVEIEVIERHISQSLNEIAEQNELVLALKQLKGVDKLEEVSTQCTNLSEGLQQKRQVLLEKQKEERNQIRSKFEEESQQDPSKDVEEPMEREISVLSQKFFEMGDKLDQEHKDESLDYLQGELGLKLNLKEDRLKRRELVAQLLFYFLMNEEELSPAAVNVISKISWPLTQTTEENWRSWLSTLSSTSFEKFYNMLGSNDVALEYFIFKRPDLIMHKTSDLFMEKAVKCLPFDSLYRIIMKVRDENGRTWLFYTNNDKNDQPSLFILFGFLYEFYIKEVFQLLAVRDNNGQTALHFNTQYIASTLTNLYTSEHRQKILELLTITDNNDQTALDIGKDLGSEQLNWLAAQIEKNRYILNERVVVLILYSSRNRKGAQEEAESIHKAFEKKYGWISGSSVTLEKDKCKDEIIYLIAEVVKDDVLPVSVFIVVLAAHGSVGTVEDYEGVPINLKLIEKTMCRPHLKNRPKILITQCCQSTLKDADKITPFAPTSPDFCAIMSSVAGQKSLRGVFLPKLAEHIADSGQEDIFKIMSKVCQELEREKHPQSPIIMGTLKSQFSPNNAFLLSALDSLSAE